MTLCNIIIPLRGEKMTKTKSQLISKEELIKVFIEDRTEGKKKFVTWFLNHVMEEEVTEQLNAESYGGLMEEKDSGMEPRRGN